MGLDATGWHILSLCLFPVINFIGISGSVFLSASKNRLLLSFGVIFSAGILLAAALVHMLPHAVTILDGHFGGGEDSHDSHADEDIHVGEEEELDLHHDEEEDDHSGHDHMRRILYLEQKIRMLEGEEEDDHSSHGHAFPWAYTFFSMAFLFLLCIEATMERFIDVYFVGKKGSFFHCHGCHDELVQVAGGGDGDGAELIEESAVKKVVKAGGSTGSAGKKVVERQGLAKEDEEANLESLSVHKRNKPPQEQPLEVEKEVVQEMELNTNTNCSTEVESSKEEVDKDATTSSSNGDAPEPNSSNGSPQHNHDHNHNSSGSHKHDHSHDHGDNDNTGDGAEGNMNGEQNNDDGEQPSREYIDVKKLHEIFLVKDGEPEHHHCHCHGHEYDELVSPSVAGARSSNLKRHNSTGGSQSGAWTKTVPRPSVVSFAVTAPLCLEEEEQVQTINPWVSILLTIVLSIHVILEGLTIGSSDDVDQLRSVFIAVALHKVFAAFSLGSSLVASGYWTMSQGEGGRTMFFVLAGVYASLDVVGLGIGMGLNEAFEDESNLVAGVLQSLLGGSFLFVSTVELIPGELEKMRNFNMPLFPILSGLLLGFGAMAVLGKWA